MSKYYYESTPIEKERKLVRVFKQIRDVISGQFCRCTGYENIVRSVRWAAEHPNGDAEAAAEPSDEGAEVTA